MLEAAEGRKPLRIWFIDIHLHVYQDAVCRFLDGNDQQTLIAFYFDHSMRSWQVVGHDRWSAQVHVRIVNAQRKEGSPEAGRYMQSG